MNSNVVSHLRSTLEAILTAPTPADLWGLQADLLATGGEDAHQAREVAEAFHSYLRDLESKVASRRASRWGAILETASVTSVGLQETMVEQEDSLQRILSSGVTAMLEVSAAVKNVEAWEVEASLIHYDVAWYLYGELWDVSLTAQPDLSWQDRQGYLDRLMGPVVDQQTPGALKSALLVKLFQAVLAARLLPLFEGTSD